MGRADWLSRLRPRSALNHITSLEYEDAHYRPTSAATAGSESTNLHWAKAVQRLTGLRSVSMSLGPVIVPARSTHMKPTPVRRTTLMAYVDESGDTGSTATRGTVAYALGCVLIDAEHWRDALDSQIEFRRRLKATYGLPMRAELKANHLIRSGGPFKHLALAPAQRSLIFRAALNWMDGTPGLHTFATVSHKSDPVHGTELLAATWTPLLQRLERTSRAWQNSHVVLVHDEGENDEIRKLGRWSRRRLSAGSGTGSGRISAPFVQLLDDPQPRASNESYFLQLADLVAYAAWRHLYAPGPAVANVVPQDMWIHLGSATLSAVNSFRQRTAPGIVELNP